MKKGFTLVEIMIVVAIIGIVIAIAVPGFIRARRVSQARACQANLQRIDGAIENYAMDFRLSTDDDVTRANLTSPDGLITEPYLRDWPSCPAGGEYGIDFVVGTAPACTADEPGHYLAAADQPVSDWVVAAGDPEPEDPEDPEDP